MMIIVKERVHRHRYRRVPISRRRLISKVWQLERAFITLSCASSSS
jgi:hypothetical protein